jgi:hypothetical protein
MFERSLEENPYKISAGMRNEHGSISMRDIEKAGQSEITDNTITPGGYATVRSEINTERKILKKDESSQEKKNTKSEENINNVFKFSSS